MKTKFKSAIYVLLALVGMPTLAFAQNTPDTRHIDFYVAKIFEYARMGITFLMIIATLWFIWTVIQFITTSDATKRTEKRKQMVAGIIGLIIIVCIWGIVYFVARTLGIGTGFSGGTLPCPPGTRPIGPAGSCI